MGTQVKFYMVGRDQALSAFIPDASPDSLNTAWNDAVYSEQEVFNLTDKNGSRLAVTVSKVEMFVCVNWNGS